MFLPRLTSSFFFIRYCIFTTRFLVSSNEYIHMIIVAMILLILNNYIRIYDDYCYYILWLPANFLLFHRHSHGHSRVIFFSHSP